VKDNGKGNGVNRKGREERKERPSLFFSKKQPLPSFAFLASFAVEVFVFAVAVAVYFAFRTPHSALDSYVSVPAKTRLTSFDPPKTPFLARSFPQNGLGASARAGDPRKC
jgi:hypothetical protein